MWDRQKRWELKRDVLFEATKKLSEADTEIVAYASILKTSETSSEIWQKEYLQRATQWNQVADALSGAAHLVAIACSRKTYLAVRDYLSTAREIGVGVSQKDSTIYDRLHEKLVKDFLQARDAIQNELDIKET